jgi:hypothetical protein
VLRGGKGLFRRLYHPPNYLTNHPTVGWECRDRLDSSCENAESGRWAAEKRKRSEEGDVESWPRGQRWEMACRRRVPRAYRALLSARWVRAERFGETGLTSLFCASSWDSARCLGRITHDGLDSITLGPCMLCLSSLLATTGTGFRALPRRHSTLIAPPMSHLTQACDRAVPRCGRCARAKNPRMECTYRADEGELDMNGVRQATREEFLAEIGQVG